ncbi:MAG: hypothetical protein ACOZDY_03140 [Pseudomonadota bacterium]
MKRVVLYFVLGFAVSGPAYAGMGAMMAIGLGAMLGGYGMMDMHGGHDRPESGHGSSAKDGHGGNDGQASGEPPAGSEAGGAGSGPTPGSPEQAPEGVGPEGRR